MLFNRVTLERIAAGEVTMAFRLWRRPTVKPGGRLRTAVGELAIVSVEPIDPPAITDAQARAAGARDRDAVLSELRAIPDDGHLRRIYRIAFRRAGPDTRHVLRDQIPTGRERTVLRERIDRLEARRDVSWVMPLLLQIADNPGVRAADLAAAVGRPIQRFKADVRKLKDLGLTVSLDVGYRLSPRGLAVVEHRDAEDVSTLRSGSSAPNPPE